MDDKGYGGAEEGLERGRYTKRRDGEEIHIGTGFEKHVRRAEMGERKKDKGKRELNKGQKGK